MNLVHFTGYFEHRHSAAIVRQAITNHDALFRAANYEYRYMMSSSRLLWYRHRRLSVPVPAPVKFNQYSTRTSREGACCQLFASATQRVCSRWTHPLSHHHGLLPPPVVLVLHSCSIVELKMMSHPHGYHT